MPDSAQSIFLLILIAPGFIAYFVFARLYCREVEDTFDKICYVFIFNIAAIILVACFADISILKRIDYASISINSIWSFVAGLLLWLIIASVAIAVIAAAIANRGWLQKTAIWLGLTYKSDSGSIIAETIRAHPTAFFKIRFNNGSYIIGHPTRYSLHADESCLFLVKAARRPARPAPGLPQPPLAQIDGPGVLLLNFDEVHCVELI